MLIRLRYAALAAVVTLSSCAAPTTGESRELSVKPFAQDSSKNQDGPGKDGDGKAEAEDEREDKVVALRDAEHELDQLRIGRKITEMEEDAETSAAKRKEDGAERTRTRARAALAHYENAEAPLKMTRAKLSLEQTVSRLASSEQDLQGILEIYQDEEEARAKNEIIRRNRKSVEFATANLKHEQAELRMLEEFEIPRRLDELKWELEEAKTAVKSAREEQQRLALKHDKARAAAEHDEAKLTRKIEKLRKELEKLTTGSESN